MSTNYVKKVKIRNNQFRFLRPVLNGWLDIVEEYVESWEGHDNPYWYTERCNVGTLAGSVWKNGGMCLEEYSSPKGSEKKHGRVDLYFTYKGYELIAEAKRGWILMPKKKNKDFKSEIESTMQAAEGDIKRTSQGINESDYHIRLGLTFLMPYWAQNTYPEHHIKYFINDIESMGYDFYAYFENKSGNDTVQDRKNGDIYNSAVLIGKSI